MYILNALLFSKKQNRSGLEMRKIHYKLGKKSFGVSIINNLLAFQFLATSCGRYLFFFYQTLSITATYFPNNSQHQNNEDIFIQVLKNVVLS